jgi:hypothetical protein
MYGVVLVRLRDENKEQVELKLLRTCLQLFLFGSNLLSEIVYVFYLLQSPEKNGFHIFAYSVLLTRLFQVNVGIYFLIISYSDHYKRYLDLKHLSDNGKVLISLLY